MRNGDAAESSLASHWPDMADALDALPDVLREKIADFQGPLPRTFAERVGQFLAILAAALQVANLEEARTRGPAAAHDAELVEGLRYLADDRTNLRVALRAACLLKQLGLDPRSDQQLARDYALTSRAAPQNIRRTIERKTGLRCRSSKSDLTRERCRQRREGARRPPRTDKWIGFEIYGLQANADAA